jgi:hypothetical protein
LLSPEAAEVQWDVLITNFKDPETTALVRENVEYISSGSSPHHAGALKAGLKEAYELKRKKRAIPTVWLLCSRSVCEQYISYSNVGSNLYCDPCLLLGISAYLQCAGCWHLRVGAYMSCRYCGVKFE